jgi:hypothetical protein
LLWDVYRERWGNGLTPYGAAVLSNLVYTAGYVGAGYLGVDPSGLRGGGASANGADGDFQTETTEEAAAAAEDAHNERMARIEAAAKDAADSCTRLGLPEKEKPDTLPPPAADDAAAPALGKSKFSKPKS